MGVTKIQWTDYVFNPWRGCRKVSPGCKNCYIDRTPVFRVTKQKHEDRVRGSEVTLKAPFAWNKRPMVCNCCNKTFSISDTHTHRHGSIIPTFHRARVFLGSLMDIFDDEIPTHWFAEALDVVRQCTELDFLMVTKRPELFDSRMIDVFHCERAIGQKVREFAHEWRHGRVVPKNVWVITSTENQEMLEKRVPHLLRIPAVVHGLSCEPLLGPLCLTKPKPIHDPEFGDQHEYYESMRGINWVIAGGESGPGARPMKVEWMSEIQRQCAEASVPYFAKQLGAFPITDNANLHDWPDETELVNGCTEGAASACANLHDKKGGEPSEWPEDMRIRQWPQSRVRP